MLTLMILFAFQVATPGEMACVGSIQEAKVPEDVYVAGVESEGTTTMAVEGQFLYLNGPGVSNLKVGSVQRIIRPEGKVHDPQTSLELGIYYVDVGTIQIAAVEEGKSAIARVLHSCHGALKGDLIVPNETKPPVVFNGRPSDFLTPLPKGPTSAILMAKDDMRELAAGQFCFIQLGKQDGVKPGDQFIVFRYHPAFNPADLIVGGTAANLSYTSMRTGGHRYKLDATLFERSLPPKVLGDIVIVEVGDRISTGKIINSMREMKPGDLVVKK